MSRATFNAALGRKIRQARDEAGLKQHALADRIEVTQNAISLYELGKRSVPLDILNDLARALEKPVSYFVDCDGAIVAVKGTKLHEIMTWVQVFPKRIHQLYLLYRFILSQEKERGAPPEHEIADPQVD